MSPKVLIERRDRVLVISLNRPAVRNAIDGDTARGVAVALDQLDSSEDIAVGVLTGVGATFCAGMDLKAFLAGDLPEVPGRGLGGLTEAPPRKPLIAAVEGWALAGGFELVLACDLVVAGESAHFGVPEVKRALVAAAGGAMLLPARIPRAIAMEMVLTGEPITAARAAEIGLINRVVPTGTALDEAVRLAETIAANGPLALAASKRIALHARDWTTARQWLEQEEIVAPVMSSEDAREGAAAFLEKRTPQWKGR